MLPLAAFPAPLFSLAAAKPKIAGGFMCEVLPPAAGDLSLPPMAASRLGPFTEASTSPALRKLSSFMILALDVLPRCPAVCASMSLDLVKPLLRRLAICDSLSPPDTGETTRFELLVLLRSLIV